MMTRQEFRDKWPKLRPKVCQEWGQLTDEDLEAIQGRDTVLSARLQQRYGIGPAEAEEELEHFLRGVRA